MKIVRSLSLSVFGDTANDILFNSKFDRSDDSASTNAVLAEHVSGQIKVAALSTEAVPFNGVTTATAILIASDQDISVRINGGTEPIPIKKSPSGKGLFYLDGPVIGVTIQNLGSSVANVVYAFTGV